MSATTLAVDVTPIHQAKALPAPNSDSYFVEALPAEELALLKKVRTYMKTKIAPIVIKYWAEDWFPFDLVTLLEFIGNLFLFPQSAGPFLTFFRKNRRLLERSKQQ